MYVVRVYLRSLYVTCTRHIGKTLSRQYYSTIIDRTCRVFFSKCRCCLFWQRQTSVLYKSLCSDVTLSNVRSQFRESAVCPSRHFIARLSICGSVPHVSLISRKLKTNIELLNCCLWFVLYEWITTVSAAFARVPVAVAVTGVLCWSGTCTCEWAKHMLRTYDRLSANHHYNRLTL